MRIDIRSSPAEKLTHDKKVAVAKNASDHLQILLNNYFFCPRFFEAMDPFFLRTLHPKVPWAFPSPQYSPWL